VTPLKKLFFSVESKVKHIIAEVVWIKKNGRSRFRSRLLRSQRSRDLDGKVPQKFSFRSDAATRFLHFFAALKRPGLIVIMHCRYDILRSKFKELYGQYVTLNFEFSHEPVTIFERVQVNLDKIPISLITFALLWRREPDFFARAPGRVNLIGEHVDYSGYPVLPMVRIVRGSKMLPLGAFRPKQYPTSAKCCSYLPLFDDIISFRN
jgi:hypothetical protein